MFLTCIDVRTKCAIIKKQISMRITRQAMWRNGYVVEMKQTFFGVQVIQNI
jgi:hypothetical protein